MACWASSFPFLILIVAGVQVASVFGANRAARFTAEEQEMFDGPLDGLARGQARRLIDQGVWIEGRPGDVLIHEGEAAAQLYYLASGAAEVHSRGKLWSGASSRPAGRRSDRAGRGRGDCHRHPHRAVALLVRARPELNAYLAANPDARHALEHSFNVSLREKLDAMNRAALLPARR